MLAALACATGTEDPIENAADLNASDVDAGPASSLVPPAKPDSCSPPTTLCSDACADLSKDVAHCGACGKKCAAGEICGDGQCATPCASGHTLCGAQCVNVQTDRAHCGACASACPGLTDACTAGECRQSITVRAYIDGSSEIVVKGGTIKWRHLTGSAPGKWNDNNHATVINSANWLPTWPFAGQNVSCNCDSSAYTGAPAMAARAQTASLTKLAGRYAASIAEQPSAANGFALRVLLDDSAPGGADWYEVRISYATK